MLPRSSGAPARLAPPRAGCDRRKLLLAGLGLLFASYLAAVHVFFRLDAAAPARQSPLLGRADAYAERRDAQEALQRARLGGREQEEPREEQELKHELKQEREQTANSTFPINPERKYVWIDVAVDDQPAGRVTIELYADLVPKTAENFRALATGEKGPDFSFHNSVCHRILTGFIVQCGDFTTGKGYGGRSIYGAKFDDEPNGLRLTHSGRYILQMANSGPNTNGSQFCFMLGAAPHLNGKHVVFGQVVDGFEVVDRMEAAGVARDGIPLTHKVSLVDGGELIFA